MVENILHDRSDIDEYEAPSRMGPRTNCPSCSPLSAALHAVSYYKNFRISQYFDILIRVANHY